MINLAPLYLITKEINDSNLFIQQISHLLDSGIRLVQYRQKNLPNKTALKQALMLRKITKRSGAKLIVNDDIQLAIKINADGVHLGIDDENINQAEQLISEHSKQNFSLGVSCYNQFERVKQMLNHPRVDLVSIGAIFPSKTKPSALKADLEFIQSVLQLKQQLKSNKQIYAIGGITHQNFTDLMKIKSNQTVLNGICICADLFDQDSNVLAKRVKTINQYFNIDKLI